MVPVFSAAKTEHGTAVEEKLREFIREGLPHVSSTVRHALPAALVWGRQPSWCSNGSGCKVCLKARQIGVLVFVLYRDDA